MKYLALHGFLGTHRDFAFVQMARPDIEWFAPDLFSDGPWAAGGSYAQWCDRALSEIRHRWPDETQIGLVGYSLGGRLALELYFTAPDLFRAPQLLSANPGVLLESSSERLAWEERWAEKFLRLPWQEVMAEWNAQPVFAGASPRLVPPEGQLNRQMLAAAIGEWSLLKHRYSLSDLSRLPAETLWMFGSEDQRFIKVRDELLRLRVPGHFVTVPGAGHRLPLDRSEEVAKAI